MCNCLCFKWEKSSVWVCDNCDHDPETHTQTQTHRTQPDSLWDEEFHPCCCRVTNTRPLPTQPSSHKHARTIDQIAWWEGFLRSFLKSIFLFREKGGRNGEGEWKTQKGREITWVGVFARDRRRDRGGGRAIQPSSPEKRAAQSVQKWPWSAAHIITQPLVSWTDA